ncbi:MAG: type II toxin-antitoxin system RelE/ParE family toxin [Betaproteobacteria bacterium]|nr:type II toxin-antitoxin system RelE/ParE family toxin [Betaproteobacteria bacterium]
MRLLWTSEALDDLADILAFYEVEAGPHTALVVERHILDAVESLRDFPERIRASERVPGARELVVYKLPYIVFVQVGKDALHVLNVVHAARRFPI